MEHTTKPAPLVHSFPKAAEILGVGILKLRDLIDSDHLPTVQIGARKMVRHSDLVALVQNGTQKAA